MIEFFKTINGKIEKVDTISKHCWINVINPDDSELEYLYSFLNIEKNFIKAALDEEETSRVESEDGNVLVIVDVPSVQKDDDTVIYSTMPLGIILTEEYIITVCLRESSVINDFTGGYIKDVETSFKTRFFLILLYKVANRFLQYLRQIEKLSVSIEKKLQISMKNKELIQILDLEKSLIYFTTSLKANEATLNKISRGGGRYLKLYDEDQELLEDVLIEIAQAIEMSQIYSSILIGTSDAFASIISNNLNIVMKRFTLISILLMIPTIITGFYGMNITTGIPLDNFWWIPIVLSSVIIIIFGFLLSQKRNFK